jgi:RNA-directed DNA polymerase
LNIITNIRDRNISELNKNIKGKKHNDLINIISDPFFLANAYSTIKRKKGAMTIAYPLPLYIQKQLTQEQLKFTRENYSLPEGITWNTLILISSLLKKGKYPWGVTRLIWIPKPGRKDNLRPINIPLFCDKIVQEAIRMILEAIYEPLMQRMNCSFGFRSSNGCREAITSIAENTQGFTTGIEGDIESAYPNMDCEILISILSEKISDQKFLNLIRNRLNRIVFDTKTQKYEETFLGLPQGGIDSPYLWNIYLIGMDKFVKERLTQLISIENKKRKSNNKKYPKNAHWLHLKSSIDAKTKKETYDRNVAFIKEEIDSLKRYKHILLEKNINKNKYKNYDHRFALFLNRSEKVRQRYIKDRSEKRNYILKIFKIRKEFQHLLKQRIKTPYINPNQHELRFHYVRYADDFLILGNFSMKFANDFKKELTDWLLIHRKAKLSQLKTLITNLHETPCKFLGFQIHANKSRKIRILTKNNKNYRKRVARSMLVIGPDKERMINRLYLKGFCDQHGKPKAMGWLIGFEPHIIIERFNTIMRGFSEYYVDFVSNKSSLNRWLYIVRWSCIKTLAQKYNTTIRKIFSRFEQPNSSINNIQVKYILKAKDIYGNVINMQKTWTLLTQKKAIKDSFKRANIKINQKLLSIKKGNFVFDYNPSENRTPRVMDHNYLEAISWVNIRTRASFDMPCVICGSTKDIEMHHIKSIKKGKFSLIPHTDSLQQLMILRNRRQCPLCKRCHITYHRTPNSTLKGYPFHLPIEYNYIRGDHRSMISEQYIHKGKIHQGLPKIESMLNSGWVTI